MSKTKKRAAKKAANTAAAATAPHGGVAKPNEAFGSNPQRTKQLRDLAERVTGFFKRGQWEDAVKALDAIRAAGLEPSGVLVNKVLSCCGKAGYAQKARALPSPRTHRCGLPHSVNLIRSPCIVPSLEAQHIFSSLWPSPVPHTVVLPLTGGHAPRIRPQPIEQALDLLEQMRAGAFGAQAKPTAVSYSAVIKYLAEVRRFPWKRPHHPATPRPLPNA